MSIVDTKVVTVTKTIVRLAPKDYEALIISAAMQEAGLESSANDLATHISIEGDELVVELMIEGGKP